MTQATDPFSNVIPVEFQGSIREFAEKTVAQAREGYDKLKDVAQTGNATIEAVCSSAAKGATEYTTRLLDIARTNTNSAFDLTAKLVTVRAPSEVLTLVTAHAREQYELLTGQAKELADLSQKVTTETVEPIKAGAAKVFSKAG